MSVFLIDRIAEERIKEVKDYAENNIFIYDESLNDQPADFSSINVQAHEIFIHVGWRFVYTVQQVTEGGIPLCYRQLSAMNIIRKRLPNPIFIENMMDLLGFKRSLMECHVFFTDETIINIMDLYEK